MGSLNSRPEYTKEQLAEWLDFIIRGGSDLSLKSLETMKLSEWLDQTGSSPSLEQLENEIRKDPLETLKKIQLWQLAAVPFGNVALHYSTHHQISLDPDTLFNKLVRRKLGGYCMENNAFFVIVLRSLGYNVYTTSARVSNDLHSSGTPGGYGGWSHHLNLVRIGGAKHMVDVGFGTTGATGPVLLKDGARVRMIPTFEGRLVQSPIAPAIDASQLLWIFEVRNDSTSPWTPQYSFSELEFLPQDFDVINYHVSHSRTSWFLQSLVLTRLILNEERSKAIGNLTLNKAEIKERRNGTSKLLLRCKSEEERVRALERYFNVKLNPEEERGIRGLPSEIQNP